MEHSERNFVLAAQQIHTVWFSSIRQQCKAYPWWVSIKPSVPISKPNVFAPCAKFSSHSASSQLYLYCWLLTYFYYFKYIRFSCSYILSTRMSLYICISGAGSIADPQDIWSKLIGQLNPIHSKARLKIREISISIWLGVTAFQSCLNFKCHLTTNYILNCNLPQLITLINIQWNSKETPTWFVPVLI